MSNTKEEALRFNEGKSRMELIPNEVIKELSEVYTKGANKYDDDNWRKGMSFRKMLASVKRHISAFEGGESIDPDPLMGTHHLANAIWGLSSLIYYDKYMPQYDDREHTLLRPLRVSLDLDGVVAMYPGGMSDSSFYNMTYNHRIFNDPGFYRDAEPNPDMQSIPFEPICYVTARPLSVKDATLRWIEDNGLPCVPVHFCEAPDGSKRKKSEILLGVGAEAHVDDHLEHYFDICRVKGVKSFLYETSYTGHLTDNPRISMIGNLSDVFGLTSAP